MTDTRRLGSLLAVTAAAAAGALLACGSGLYDASGVQELDRGAGLACDVTSQVVCGGVCTEEDASHCGASCEDCTAAGGIPAGARAACVRADGAGTCGYECGDGLLRCSSGCCPATALAAGERFTCALADDRSVSCWGANDGGQLGDGTTLPRAAPARVPLPGGASAIGAGAAHACAVLDGGAVHCWGSNASGQVTGTASAGSVPSAATTPVASGAVAVVAGAGHSCALLSTGAVRCWGAPDQIGAGGIPVPAGSATTAISAGGAHTCAVVAGAVRCWGANASGQLGNDSTSGSVATPIASGIQLVAAGASQSCAATGSSNGQAVDDAIRCWGDSLGPVFRLGSPQLVPAIPMKDSSQSTVRKPVGLLAAGRKHVCIRDRTEAIECFGANERGQLGGTPVGAAEAVTVPLPAAPPAVIATALAAGADHTCAIVSGGRLRCWGANDVGQLGDGTTADPGVGAIVTPVGR